MSRDLLAQVPLLAQLPPKALDDVAALVRRHRYAPGDVIFHQGDPGTALYIVEDGEVKIVLGSSDGKEVILRLLGRGDFLGELALLDGEPRSAEAVATLPTTLLILPRDAFAAFVTEHPQAALVLLTTLSRRLRGADNRMHDAVFLDVRTRLVKLLVDLAETRGRPDPRGVMIASRLTQADLAGMVGATRESVNKWLRYYAEKGLILHERQRLTVLDLKRLRAELS
ncbi:MAG TPA: Crp/Fnr family transcriptional regulator [bacterium]|nr:Crp/Fnr family transcriptional regulator [bacterium]